ncbi:aminotransferase [Rubrobacter xylanophilus DSM 9941]|uniref:Diaminobutyrate--2-oxoglutarate transaminase n=1 Tax=Rubrobacter xylanophilus (strain DSM 9941 / JCM 11954 / NBRC 16129 / PRD-1) TaxID=266117 RepID=Q1AYZ2_RUBXD|nr:aminotransferase [Rubrobacter xylanophilus DSM 9941]
MREGENTLRAESTAAFRARKGLSEGLLERQAARESNARTYPRSIPIAVSRARGPYVWDADGRRYLDCLSGAGTLALGHNHPVVVEAIREVLDRGGPLHTLDLATPVKDRFVEELFGSLPRRFAERARIHFCGPAGADAVEAAVKLAKTATGRETVLSFSGGYHGMTHGALSLTGKLAPKEPLAGLMPGVHFLPYPYGYRCPFGVGGEDGWRVGARYVERLLDDPESGVKRPAAMVLEVVQGEGGSIPAPDGWVREMRRITRERGIPLIVDEIQTGLGRTGTVWAFERPGIEPDAVVMSKAIGGSLPLAAVVYDAALDVWEPGAHTGTFRGNQLAMAAGAATVRHVLKNRLHEHAARMGELLLERLREVQREAGCVGEVRGRGLMVGVEVVDPEAGPDPLGSRPARPDLARRVQAEALRRGLILETGGRHGAVVRLLPPLIIAEEEAEEICALFGEAVLAASRGAR